jgi:predicted alpha/beta-hydrolase family hydrolase
MLFLQGTRDAFAELALLEPVCARLAQRATLHVVEGADHSFRVPKRAGRSDADVLTELTTAVDDWSRAILA